MKITNSTSTRQKLSIILFALICSSFNGFTQITFQPSPSFFRTDRELPLTEISTSNIINVSNYGAIVNDGIDDTQAITNALNAAKNANTPTEVRFEPGIYEVSGITGDSHTFELLNANNIVLNGNGSEILLNNPTVGFLKIIDSENIIVKDFTIDYSTLPFTQGKVVEVNAGQNYFLLEIDEGFPMINQPHLRDSPQAWGMLKNADGSLKDGAPNLFKPRNSPFQFIRTRTFKYNLNSGIEFVEVGDNFVYIGRYNGKTIFNTTNCKQVTYMGITSYASPAGSYNAFGNREWNILNCKIMIKPNSGRLHSANADCIHVSGGFVGPWVQGCEFSGYSDDAMNIKHTKRDIVTVNSPNQIVLKYEVAVGDVLRFYNPRDGIDLGTATVTSAQNIGNSEFRINLSTPINITNTSTHQLGDKCYIDSRSNESFVIRNNTFKNARRYGLLLQSTYGIVENNQFENLSTGGIVIKNAVDWAEGFVVNQIKIDGNTIKNCGYDKTYLDEAESAAISTRVYKLGTPCLEGIDFCGELPSNWQGHTNITITNNTISYNKKGLQIENVDTGLIKCNTITPNNSFSGVNLGDVFLNNNSNLVVQNENCSLSDVSSTQRYVSADGNDDTGSGSSGNPYLTLSKTISESSDGDKIIIVGTITQNSQIAFNKAITFEGTSNAIIQSTGANRLFNITADAAKTITFTDITFQNFNSAFQGSVLNHSSQSGMTLTFTNCNFLNNSTSSDNGGGALYIAQSSTTANFTGCTFYNNAVITSTAPNARGAAIHFLGQANSTITNCTFSENKITKTGNFDGAAIRVNSNDNVITVQNSLFYNNKTDNGDGVVSDCSGVTGATLNFLNSLAQYTNNVDLSTESNMAADFTNTTFTFVSPNLTYTAANDLATEAGNDTPIDFGSYNNDVGAWDSGINIFEGTTSILWSEDSNWSSGTAPVGDGIENIAIIGNICNMFSAGVAVNDIKVTTELRIQNQNVFIVNGESDVTGTVRYFANLQDNADPAKAWHLVSSPLSGEVFDVAFADKNDIATGNGSNRGIATYNPGATGSTAWTYFSDANNSITATSGQGFSMKITPDGITFADGGGEYADNAVGFEGDFNTDNAGVTVSTPTTGFNLLGNPYTAHVNSATFLGAATSSNIDQSQIWVWDQTLNSRAGGYEAKMSGESFILAPAQGFFVKVNTIGSVNFAESNQATTGGTFQKTSRTKLKLLVSDNANSRFAKLYFLEDATKGYDFGWEGEVFGGVTNDFELYTHLVNDNQGKKYQKQSLPKSELESLIIPVGVLADAGKELIFSLEISNFPTDIKVYLEDRFNNTFTEISNNKTYKVSLSEKLNSIGRFYLHTSSSALSTATFNTENIRVYATNKSTLRIAGLSQGKTRVKLFNILGKQVLNTSFISSGVYDVNLPKLTSGIYIIQLENVNGALNKKIVLD